MRAGDQKLRFDLVWPKLNNIFMLQNYVNRDILCLALEESRGEGRVPSGSMILEHHINTAKHVTIQSEAHLVGVAIVYTHLDCRGKIGPAGPILDTKTGPARPFLVDQV